MKKIHTPKIHKTKNREALIQLYNKIFTIIIIINIAILLGYFVFSYLNAEVFFNSFLKNLFTTNLPFGDVIFNSIKDNSIVSVQHLYNSFFMPLSIVDTLIFILPLFILQVGVLLIKHFALKKDNAIFRLLVVIAFMITTFLFQNNSFSILTGYFNYSRENILILLNLFILIELIVYAFLLYSLHKANRINLVRYLSHERAKKIVVSSTIVSIILLAVINFGYNSAKQRILSFEDQLKINYVIDLQKNVNGVIPINPPEKVIKFTQEAGITLPKEIEKTEFMTALGITTIDIGGNFNKQLHSVVTQFLDNYINPPIERSFIAIAFLAIILVIELIATKLRKFHNIAYVLQFLISMILFITIGKSAILFLSLLFVITLFGSSIHIFNISKVGLLSLIELYKSRERSLRYENRLLKKSVIALTIENAKYKNIRKGKGRRRKYR